MSEREVSNFVDIDVEASTARETTRQATPLMLSMHRLALWVSSPRPYLMLIGFALFLGFWYCAVEVWKLPRFAEMPGPTEVVKEWFSKDPTYGTSIFTEEYYLHIWVSIRRVAIAFFLATGDRRAARPVPGMVAEVQGLRVSGLRAAAPDSTVGLGAAGHRDLPRLGNAGDLPDVSGVVLRHGFEHDARGSIDRRLVCSRRKLPWRQSLAGVSAT